MMKNREVIQKRYKYYNLQQISGFIDQTTPPEKRVVLSIYPKTIKMFVKCYKMRPPHLIKVAPSSILFWRSREN